VFARARERERERENSRGLGNRGVPLRAEFPFPVNSHNFHEASCCKAQSSRGIGNFARHLLMRECVSADGRPKNEIECYANANSRAIVVPLPPSSSPDNVARGRLNLSVIGREKNRSAREKGRAGIAICPPTGLSASIVLSCTC